MTKKIKWNGEKLKFVKRHFANGTNMTVFLIDETNFPHFQLSIPSKKANLEKNEIIVDDLGKNKGIKKLLIKSGYLIPTDKWIEIKNQLCEICKVL